MLKASLSGQRHAPLPLYCDKALDASESLSSLELVEGAALVALVEPNQVGCGCHSALTYHVAQPCRPAMQDV